MEFFNPDEIKAEINAALNTLCTIELNDRLDNRLHELARNYFESVILNKNPAIIELMNNITHSSGRKVNPIEASLDFT
jgi:hypothetical protein